MQNFNTFIFSFLLFFPFPTFFLSFFFLPAFWSLFFFCYTFFLFFFVIFLQFVLSFTVSFIWSILSFLTFFFFTFFLRFFFLPPLLPREGCLLWFKNLFFPSYFIFSILPFPRFSLFLNLLLTQKNIEPKYSQKEMKNIKLKRILRVSYDIFNGFFLLAHTLPASSVWHNTIGSKQFLF